MAAEECGAFDDQQQQRVRSAELEARVNTGDRPERGRGIDGHAQVAGPAAPASSVMAQAVTARPSPGAAPAVRR